MSETRNSGRSQPFDEMRQSGGTLIEYAVRYDEPETYAGLVNHHGYVRSFVESWVRSECRNGFKCVVVQRTVTFGEWANADERPGSVAMTGDRGKTESKTLGSGMTGSTQQLQVGDRVAVELIIESMGGGEKETPGGFEARVATPRAGDGFREPVWLTPNQVTLVSRARRRPVRDEPLSEQHELVPDMLIWAAGHGVHYYGGDGRFYPAKGWQRVMDDFLWPKSAVELGAVVVWVPGEEGK